MVNIRFCLVHFTVKVEGFLLLGLLRPAYMAAVLICRVDLVVRVRDAARNANNQEQLLNMCDIWLAGKTGQQS